MVNQELVDALRDAEAVKFGEFELSHGGTSEYYVDKYVFETDPRCLGLIASAFADRVGEERPGDGDELLLAGAQTVQVCSTLYKNGIDRIGSIRNDIEQWMTETGYDSIDDFRGKLSQSNSEEPEAYERMQYIKAITGVS